MRLRQDAPSHVESWLVSYCDMISLLVTFFLMMLTFSTSAENDVREVGIGILRGRGGVWDHALTLPKASEIDPELVDALARDVAALCETKDGNARASVRKTQDGFALGFGVASSFAPGSAEPNAALRENLVTVGRFLVRYSHLIVVEGFTDDHFAATPEFENAESLALARARAAAEILLGSSGLRREQVELAGLGALRPRAPNTSALGRTSNRRVEVRMVALEAPVLADAGGAR